MLPLFRSSFVGARGSCKFERMIANAHSDRINAHASIKDPASLRLADESHSIRARYREDNMFWQQALYYSFYYTRQVISKSKSFSKEIVSMEAWTGQACFYNPT